MYKNNDNSYAVNRIMHRSHIIYTHNSQITKMYNTGGLS